ncbi:hypothetical protein ILP31_20020 [Pectobacterium punjabense]|uniref:DUF7415 domain-containing protein n=1 Tax=Pectobacterium punjabense TaxID=2108399 RepID=UPI001BFFB6C2|nr:hypothetical protein [Pectobacterium punjabense]MBT9186374.1 hypothetical protein [Pectobacterium punjabense]
MQSIDWNEISRRGLLVRINSEIMHPIGLAIFRDPDSGQSGGALVADDGVWQYEQNFLASVAARSAMNNAEKAQTLAAEIAEQERGKADLAELVLSEVSDFFAGIGQPGAPETAEEMQAALMARVESVMRDHQ